METQRSSPPKSSTHRMLCSGYSWPTIFGLPSSSKFRIVHLNCAVHLAYRCRTPNPVRKPTREWQKGQQELMHLWETQHLSQNCMELKNRQSLLPPLNSWEDLIKAYTDYFKGIGQFPEHHHTHHLKRWCQTYHPCTKEVSYSHVTPSMWQAREVYQSRTGVITCRFIED